MTKGIKQEGYKVLSKTERLQMMVQEADAVGMMLQRPRWGSLEWESLLDTRLARIRDLTDLTVRKGTVAGYERRVYDPNMVPVGA